MAKLIISFPDGRSSTVELTLKPQDMGRDPSCSVQLDDPTVSRRHADIRGNSQGRFTLRDLGSKNGTQVNNIPITTHPLEHGDEILFGSVSARFEGDAAPEQSSVVTYDDLATLPAESVSFISATRQLQLSQQRLQMLYDISSRLTGLRDRNELLADIMAICLETFEFERGAIGLKRPDKKIMDWPIVHNLQGPDGGIRISRTILKQALEDGQRAVFSETDQGNVDPTVSMVQQGTRSAMCVPITDDVEIMGILYGDRISTTKRYGQEDVDFFAALARQACIGLTNNKLLEEQQQKIFLEREISIARQIQGGLFPDTHNVHPDLTFAAINDPGRQVSGDYYDVVNSEASRIGIIIADVSGKGVSSAMLSANMQSAVHLLFAENLELHEIATKINRLMCDNTDSSRFVTAILASLDPTTQQLQYVSCGHDHPILIDTTTQEATILEASAHLPLGVMRDETYEVTDVQLRAGSTLFMYTDGLKEAWDESENEFGNERILNCLRAHAIEQPQTLIESIRSDLGDFCGDVPQSDDITLLAVNLH